MAHTFTSQLLHCVFSTKNRLPTIDPEWRPRLHAYMGGIARENGVKALVIGGVADHAHILLSLPPVLSLSQAMQLIKVTSSKWVHETIPNMKKFAWQEGFGAFSIGIADQPRTVKYIENQEAHHKRLTFQDEFRLFLKKHGIEYDEKYIWG